MPLMSAPSDPPPLNARYFDGRSAAGAEVKVTLSRNDLVLRDGNGEVVVRWPRAEVHIASPAGSQYPRLRRGFSDDARLSLADADLDRLKPFLGKLNQRESAWRETWRPILIFAGAAGLSIWLLVAAVIPRAADFVARQIPAEWEEKLGTAARDQVIELFARMEGRTAKRPLICGGKGTEDLARVIGKIQAHTETSIRIKLWVADLKLVNAFALPGGDLVLTRGLIQDAEGGNEVAAVMAHEIGHIKYKHPTKVALEHAAVASIAGLMVGDLFGGSLIAGIGNALISSAYSREAEDEADVFAVTALNKAGWDARPMADFFERLATAQGSAEEAMSLISSHPLSTERAAAVRAKSTGRGEAFSPAQWARIRKVCE